MRPAALALVLAPLLGAPLGLAEHGPGESGAWAEDLPQATSAAAAVTDGRYVYVLGGHGNGGLLATVQRLDPRGVAPATVTGELPHGVAFAGAVWMQGAAYVFGGRVDGPDDRILRHDPATNTSTVMSARLPWGAEGTMAATDGEVAYVVAGNAAYRYDPRADRLDILDVSMPANLSHGAAVWDGARLLAFGATLPGGVEDDRILVLDPELGEARFAQARLPSPRTHASAAWSGTRAYVFGGGTDATPLHREVLQYDPEADALRIMEPMLPTARSRTVAAAVEGRIYVLGGSEMNGPTLAEVWRFTPPQAHDAEPLPPLPPVARLELRVDGLLVTANATGSSDPDGAIASWRIDWGDGNASLEAFATHAFASPGRYVVNLTVTDEDGLHASVEQEVMLIVSLTPTTPPPVPSTRSVVTGEPPVLEGEGGGLGDVPVGVWVAVGFAGVGAGALLLARLK